MFKAIIFDFFDVIRTDAYKAWLSNHGYARDGQFAELSNQMDGGIITAEDFLEGLARICGRPANIVLEEMETGTKVDDNVVKIIEELQPHFSLGLLSNSPSTFLRGLLKDHDLEKYFSSIVISSEVGMIKPSAEIFHHTLKTMQVQPQEAIFIDDNEHNIAAAEALGITGIHFVNAVQLKNSLQKLNITL